MITKVKTTPGFLVQEFDDKGKAYRQGFVVGTSVFWEDREGNSVEPIEHEKIIPTMYQPEGVCYCEKCTQMLTDAEYNKWKGICPACKKGKKDGSSTG